MKGEFSRIILIPAPDDAPLESAEYQNELRELERALHSRGVKPNFALDRLFGVGGGGEATYSGAFLVLATTLPIVGHCLVAWINRRSGRRVRLEIGKNGSIKAEGRSAGEVEALIQAAQKHLKSGDSSRERRPPGKKKPKKKKPKRKKPL